MNSPGAPEKRMGINEVKDTFNTAAAPAFMAETAVMRYAREPDNPKEWQVLTFSGRAADGTAFSITSPRLEPGADLHAAAKKVAAELLNKGNPPP